MNPQKDATTTRQVPEQRMVDEDNQWTLEGPTRILKMESLSASIATNTDTWQRNADQRRKNKRPGYALCDKEGHIVKDCKEKQMMKKRKV